MNERLDAIVSGRVQMVTYRDFAMRTAAKLGLTGEARNLPDGTVRIVAEGARSALDTYINELKEGPEHARVTDVVAEWHVATGEYPDFRIAFD